MKPIIGILLVLAGLAFGLYVGVYVCFIGGIVDIINEVKAVNTSVAGVAFGVLKMMFATFLGGLSAIILVLPGIAFIKS
jgi:phage-related protein